VGQAQDGSLRNVSRSRAVSANAAELRMAGHP